MHHDTQLEGKSAGRIDARRFVDDIVGGVLLAPPAACNQCYYQSGCTYGSPTGYYTSGQGGYVTSGGGYYGGGYQGGYAQPGYAQPGYAQPGYAQPGYGQPGYNPGGLGGPASGIGVRPGMGAGGFGPGR